MRQRKTTTDPLRDLPVLGTLVSVFLESPERLRSGSSAESLPSKVEDVIPRPSPDERDQLLIAAPAYVGDVEPPREGNPMAIVWPTPREMREVAAAFVNEELSGPLVRVWRVAIMGKPIRVQRRNYGRVPMSLDVRVMPMDAADPEASARTGRTVDVSEGGLLCSFGPPPFPPGAPLLIELTIEETPLSIRASVIRTYVTLERNGKEVVLTAIRFDNPDEYGDVVRQAVFAEQIRIRKRGLDAPPD